MKMKYGLWFKVTVILLALAFLTQSSAYAQDFTQDAGSEEAWTKEGLRQERNPGVPKLATPNPKTAYVPPPLQLSPSQRAIMSPSAAAAYDSHAAALQGATRYNVAPMELYPRAKRKKEDDDPETAAKEAAAKEAVAKEAAAKEKEAVAKFTKEGVPIFDAPQYFPQGPTKKATQISKIIVPPPSAFAHVGLADDLKEATAWAYDDCDDDYGDNCDNEFVNGLTTLIALNAGENLGKMAGTEGFPLDMSMYLVIGECYDFAFKLGFLKGLIASECDPGMYLVLCNELLKRMKEAEDKAKKRQLNPFAPAGGAGGMGGGSGGGSSGGGGGGGPC